MGLDMYLTRNTYVKNWDYMGPENQTVVTVLKGGSPHPHIDPSKVSYITEEVGYWRKANAIHQWFVENVQDGVDECQESYVSRAQLTQLLETVRAVKADHSKAPELLPSKSGFFFGSTDYDEYYYQDLDDTEKILSDLDLDHGSEYEYRASW